MAGIKFHEIRRSHGSQGLHGMNIDIAEDEFDAPVGPTNCRSSTQLRVFAALQPTVAETAAFPRFEGQGVTAIVPERHAFAPDDMTHLKPDAPHLYVFDADTGHGVG